MSDTLVATERKNPVTTPKLARWKKLLFGTIVVVFLLAFFEISARIGLKLTRGFDGKHLYQYVFDPYKNLQPTPNFVDTRGIRHNSVGFRRSAEVPIEKPAGTYRIFLMGASTAYGLGGLWPHIQREFAVLDNSETIDAYLEALLGDSVPGAKVEVINAAITSTWTHHHLIYLNQRILRYDPDMVLFLDGFNDFYKFEPGHDQFASYSYNLPSRRIMGDPTFMALLHANGWWLFRKSAAAHVASRGARTLKQLVSPRPKQTPVNVDSALAGLHYNFPRNGLAMHKRAGLILQGENVHAVFMLQPLLILQRNRPGMPAIEQRLFEFNVSSYRPNYESFITRAVPYIREAEAAMAQQVGGDFIDLTDIPGPVNAQVFTDYAHLTPLGNQLVAQRIANRILPTIKADLAAGTQAAPEQSPTVND
jgi:lysophospholipase L1-like esterase